MFLQSCLYKKVIITKEERNNIIYKNKQLYLYESNIGNIDTLIIFKNYPNGYEPNFDFWFRKKVVKSDTISTRRDFGKRFSTYPNYEMNKLKNQNINLSVDILYMKTEFDNELKLTIYPFNEEFSLTGKNGKQYIFENNASKNLETCKTNSYCVNKIIYQEGKGIVFIEKGSGEIWKLLKQLK